MTIENYKKAGDLLLEMQRIDEIIDCLYENKLNENSKAHKERWDIQINGFSTIITDKTFNTIIDGLRNAHKKAEEELEKL